MIHTTQKGFTLAEVLTVIGIFLVMTSIVIFNYNQFRGETILTNMAYEIALSIREAQIYGISVRNSGTTFDKEYGIYLPINSQEYILFSNQPTNPSDKIFTGTSCADPGFTDFCVTTYTLQRKMIISNIQEVVGTTCADTEPAGLSILFERPNPEPIINGTIPSMEDLSHVEITITSPTTNTNRFIEVYKNGQIAVLNKSVCQ